MLLMKVVSAVSAIVLGVALCLLALALLGARLGWWHYGFSLYRLFPASGVAAAGAVALSLATLALGRSRLDRRAVAMLALGLGAGVSLAYLPSWYAYARYTLPPINDIATDPADRPAFHAVLAARAAERIDRVDTPEPRLSRLQAAAYPEIAPVRTALPARTAFSEALGVAQSMPGWTIVASDAVAGRIEASQESRWFGFTDDVVIRVGADIAGSRIDMRSASRKGRHDHGVNAARIRAYVGALRKRIERYERQRASIRPSIRAPACRGTAGARAAGRWRWPQRGP
jgi:uncharacterized protein (DUF1499 family)